MKIRTEKIFDETGYEPLAKVLGSFTNSKIDDLLKKSEIQNINPTDTKWRKINDAFIKNRKKVGHNKNIIKFIDLAIQPVNFINAHEEFQTLRGELNKVLAFSGLEVSDTGKTILCSRVFTLTESEKRASLLNEQLIGRNIHSRVLEFCQAELLKENYFHAVLEAVKSICERLRELIDSTEEGDDLINECFKLSNPKLQINRLSTKGEKMEQAGFSTLIKGIYSMFRNPTAHESKINWEITLQDAADLLSMVSMVHRRLDHTKLTTA